MVEHQLAESDLFILRLCAEWQLRPALLQMPVDDLARQWAGSSYEGWTSSELQASIDRLRSFGYVKALSSRPIGTAVEELISITPAGAAAWESHARPDWNYYFEQRWVGTDDELTEEVNIVCGSLDCRVRVAGALVEYLALCQKFGMQDMKFASIKPWQATYWKVLPEGHSFQCTVREAQLDFETVFQTQEQEMRRRYLHRYFVNWQR